MKTSDVTSTTSLISLIVVQVMITSVDRRRIDACLLQGTEPLDRVKDSWAAKFGCSTDSFVVLANGNPIEDSALLGDVPRQAPEIVSLTIEDKVPMNLTIFGTTNEPKILWAAWSERVGSVYGYVRHIWLIGREYAVRLRCGDNILTQDRPLREAEGQEMCVELGWNLIKRRNGVPYAEVIAYYSDLLDVINNPEQTLMLGTSALTSIVEAETALLTDFAVYPTAPLYLDEHQPIAAVADDFVSSEIVEAVRGLSVLEPQQEAMVGQELVPHSAMPLCPLQLVVISPLRLVVVHTNRRRAIIRVPRSGIVLDILTRALPASRISPTLQVVFNERVLDRNESLQMSGLKDGSEVSLRKAPDTITVCEVGRTTTWRMSHSSVTFTDIVAGIRRMDLMKAFLACEGCGRKLCNTWEDHQSVPVACCKVKSMTLHVVRRTRSE